MMSNPVDARMTFDSFVVGPGNRLASAAARRAADSPAASYNPLFLYSASGLGKSHILNAMAHHSERLNPDSQVLYQTLEGYLDELAEAIQQGTQEELKDRYRDLDILLLDDVQFLTGQTEAQELLLRTLDSLNLSGSQIVLASDRPPAEIDGLDARLLSRFSGGLMVDIAPPELETRVAIVRKKCEARKIELAEGVSEQIARLPFRNVRELMGGLNRVLAAQELEGRAITAEDIAKLVDIPAERPRRTRRADRLSTQMPSEMFEASEEPWQRVIREAAEEAEAEGFATGRLRRVLDGDMEPTDPDQIIADFHGVLDELRQIRSDLDVVGNPWPEAARGVLLDPDRVEEARALLASARERVRDFPPFPLDMGLQHLEGRYPPLAIKAATQLIGEEPPEYNPLFVWSPDGHGSRMLLEAAGASCLSERPGSRVAFISAKEFAEEFIDALSDGVAGAWRERWWTVELLLVYGCEELSNTERAQDEFFHLFEAVKRRGARVLLAADRAPSRIDNIDDRLQSRFEGGLVVELNVTGVPPTPAEELLKLRQKPEADETLTTDVEALAEGGEVGPNLQVMRPGDLDAEPEESNPEFDRALGSLDGGSEEAAWNVPSVHAETPEALTSLTVRPDDFPTLISEREKERARAGLDSDPGSASSEGEHTAEPQQSIESSGEAAASTESVAGSESFGAAPQHGSHEGASSEAQPAPSPSSEPQTPTSIEQAPILTAADLAPMPEVAAAREEAPTANAAGPDVEANDDATSAEAQHVAESPDVASEHPRDPDPFTETEAYTPEPLPTIAEAPPVVDVDPGAETAVDAAVPAHTEGLDDGALDDAMPVASAEQAAPTGPWVAEALPAVLEDELDHVIDSVFTAHAQRGLGVAEAATEAPTDDSPAAPAAAETPAADSHSSQNGTVEAAETPELPQAERASSDDSATYATPGSDDPLLPTGTGNADYSYETPVDSGVATRTRARRAQYVEPAPPVDNSALVDAAVQAPIESPVASPTDAPAEVTAPSESTPAAQATEATDSWAPSREKTVWEWPSLEDRMVVEE